MSVSFGKYTIEKKLGEGGMGAVYLVSDPALDRKVALKVISSNDPETLERFRLEAQSVAKFTHSHIVRVYEAGTVNNQEYFTMDYIEGVSLDKFALSQPKPAFKDIARLIHQTAQALEYAHNQGIIHRDIKPANILIDQSGNAYLTDFGIAKNLTGLNKTLTMTGMTVGTPEYMSPEQAMGKKKELDPRSDIFSLGATLYHCITGRLPFEGEEIYDVFSKIINNDPVMPRLANKTIPRDLETICMKCLEKEPNLRYQNAGELAGDLGRFMNDEAILARPVSMAEKLWRKAKKNKIASFGIAGGVIILGIGLAISTLVSSVEAKDKIEVYRQEGRAYFDQHKYEDAKASYEKILEIDYLDMEADEMKDKCVQAIKEKEAQGKKTKEQAELRARAKTVLDRAERTPTPEQKIKIAEDALDEDPTYAEAWQLIGMSWKEKRDYDRAYECFSKAIELQPTHAYAYYERALITAYQRNKPEEAIPDFEMVFKYDPNSHIGYFARGNLENDQKQSDEAIKSYTKAIEIYPGYTHAYNNRGNVYNHKGELDRAIADYNEALALDPKLTTAYYNRAGTYLDKAGYNGFPDVVTPGELIDKAIQDYGAVLRLDPKFTQAYLNRATAYKIKGELDRVIADLSKVLELCPESTAAYHNRGNAYKDKGELDRAIADYNEALQINPKLAETYTNRGVAYADKNELERAITDYNEALRLDPKHANAYLNRGFIYHKKKDFKKAKADWERYLELAPNGPQAAQIRQAVGQLKVAIKMMDGSK